MFRTKFGILLLFKMQKKFAMPPNQINFENFHFNPFQNESFFGAEDERHPDENFFNEVNT